MALIEQGLMLKSLLDFGHGLLDGMLTGIEPEALFWCLVHGDIKKCLRLVEDIFVLPGLVARPQMIILWI